MAYINPHVEWICRLAIGWLLPNTKTMPTIKLLANKIIYRLLILKRKNTSDSHSINENKQQQYISSFKEDANFNKSALCNCILPACQTYCTHTYVLAKKKSQLTGIKNRHTKSDVIAMHTNSIVNACKLTRKMNEA